MDSCYKSRPRIICTQPRRISAISVAERVALERNECLGESVGYQIRLEAKLPTSDSYILYCTTGIVLQWLKSNPSLDRITHLILDEIHERDIQCDFLITLLKDLVQVRPNLKVILMSATLNSASFSKYFNNCPSFHIPGTLFPIQEYYLEDVLEMTNYDPFEDPRISQTRNPGPKWHKYTRRGKEASAQDTQYNEFIQPFIRDLRLNGKYREKTINSLLHPKGKKHALIKYDQFTPNTSSFWGKCCAI